MTNFLRALPKNTTAIVEIKTQRPICLEVFKEFKELGRVMLRVGSVSVAAGVGEYCFYCVACRLLFPVSLFLTFLVVSFGDFVV